MFKSILKIVQSGLGIIDKKLATKFEHEHHKILIELRDAQNAGPGEYSDAELNILEEKLLDFLEAFANVLETHRNNSSN